MMITRSDRAVESRIRTGLNDFERTAGPLPGLTGSEARDAFIEQLVESARRKRYLEYIRDADLAPISGDPSASEFDALRAAVLSHRSQDVDEALWLLFLYTHFGYNRRAGWRHIRDVYGALGGTPWTWRRVSASPGDFQSWVRENLHLLNSDAAPRGFGNHRKYESFRQVPEVVASYVSWVGPGNSHHDLLTRVSGSPHPVGEIAFQQLFDSLRGVLRFGRTAAFDYLSTAGRLGILSIKPGRMYLVDSTGPFKGAKALVGGGAGWTRTRLDDHISHIDDFIGVGKDALEDAVCNWQKSPDRFKSFRG